MVRSRGRKARLRRMRKMFCAAWASQGESLLSTIFLVVFVVVVGVVVIVVSTTLKSYGIYLMFTYIGIGINTIGYFS